jgi:hypothetical protein
MSEDVRAVLLRLKRRMGRERAEFKRLMRQNGFISWSVFALSQAIIWIDDERKKLGK